MARYLVRTTFRCAVAFVLTTAAAIGWLSAPTFGEQASTEELTGPARISDSELYATDAVLQERGLDPGLVSLGEVAFQRSCTTCHDAQRAMAKRKRYAQWLGTVQRMAAKEGADIVPGDVVPIATYLAFVAGSDTGPIPIADGGLAEQQTLLYATLSLLWRGSNGERPLENPGFFPDVRFGAEWRTTGPISARITACTSCHADTNPSRGFSLELVEASATIDLAELVGCCRSASGDPSQKLSASLTLGRFVVPFGAIAAQSHPGASRTLTLPLMFNMGRRVGSTGPLQPVLPAPYADEGVDLRISAALVESWLATLDVYAVNGLQGVDPSLFNTSRSYMDNNLEPAVGGRASLGNSAVRVGGSVMSGNLADQTSDPVQYHLAGGDITARFEDQVRLYCEYAIRRDQSTILPGVDNIAYGMLVEGELRLLREPNISFLARYDTLEHRHALFPDASLDRFTYGLRYTSAQGSVLLLDHEHWMFDDGSDVDVIGFRWVAVF